jgi:sulfatase modifying factor 1
MLALLAVAAVWAAPVQVGAGTHTPFYPPSGGQTEVPIAAFRMDATPVTVGEYRAFVEADPAWQKGAPPVILADEGYLSAWAGPADPGALSDALPVTGVSWFAARAYCRAVGGDLPTVFPWVYAADATADAPAGGRKDQATLARILAWYGEGPGASLRPVGQGTPSYWGLYDMHGLVWEWTLDFNSLLVSADVREAGEAEDLRFCGAGALSARDVEDYASFMRFAMRSALKAAYTTEALGFRCAY